MLAWIARGLRIGIVTTRYPRAPEPAPPGFRGRIEPIGAGPSELAALCLTGAIAVSDGVVAVDRRRCILCGACVEAAPEVFRFVPEYETASAEALRQPLGARVRALRRSVHITTSSGSASSSRPLPATPTSCSSPEGSPPRWQSRCGAPGR